MWDRKRALDLFNFDYKIEVYTPAPNRKYGCIFEVKALQLSGQAQSLLGTDLRSPIHKCFPLAEAQKGLETYLNHMSAGKILLVANPQESLSTVETNSSHQSLLYKLLLNLRSRAEGWEGFLL